MITNLNELINALGNSSQSAIINKASIANQVAGGFSSLWRATGTPGQGAIPTSAAIPTNSTTGSLVFSNGTNQLYIARTFFLCSNSAVDVQVHDRLAHMGGLSGTVTTAQTVDIDITGSSNNIANRRNNYTGLQWWVEIYTDIGTTAQTATVTYTRFPGGGGNTGQTTTLSIGGASPANRAGRMFPIIPNGTDIIQSIESIQHASTAAAGNYGITCTRLLMSASLGLANNGTVYDWAQTGLPEVYNSSCLFLIQITGTTSTGTQLGTVKIVEG